MFRIIALFGISLLLINCTTKPIAKNHVIFIVDGMGPAHITGARLFKGGPESKLELEKMPYSGVVRTHSSDNYTTDSAAAATALASGIKTVNRAVGVVKSKDNTSDQPQELATILDRAIEAGKSTGLISTARITHATPAAYYAHVPHRDMEDSIAAQLLRSNIDVIIGGGRRFFVGPADGGDRKDKKNLLKDFAKKGYRVVQANEEFSALPVPSKQKIIALLESDHLPYDLDRTNQPALDKLVDYAIRHLSKNPKGYFLIIEAARVDHASHENVARHAFGDMLAFDRALQRANLESESDTLTLVTSDHETGGLALNGYAPFEQATGNALLENHSQYPNAVSKHTGLISWASGPGFNSPPKIKAGEKNFKHRSAYAATMAFHSAVDVPVFARGPGADRFTGFLDNTELVHKSIEILKLEPLK